MQVGGYGDLAVLPVPSKMRRAFPVAGGDQQGGYRRWRRYSAAMGNPRVKVDREAEGERHSAAVGR